MCWGDLARSQGGAITRDQLRQAGLTDDGIDGLVASSALDAVTRGVFTVRGAPRSLQNRLWSAVLATRGVLGFGTAAFLWGVLDTEPMQVDVIVGHERRVAIPPGVRVRRVFVPRTVIACHEGLPITARSWTVLDQLGRLPDGEAYRLADRALQRAWITPDDVARRVRDYPGRTGNRMLRRIAAQCADGAAAESERVLHRLLRRAGVRDWRANHPIRVDGELVAVVDVALPQARLAIEIDGWAHHSDVDRFQNDRQRQNLLVALGWTVLRFTWWDLTQRPDYVLAVIHGQLAKAS